MTVTHVPVLIVGAGVGGLAASALLAQHGVRSLLVDKRHETFTYPKARNLSFRSLEILRGLGVGDQIRAVAEHVSTMLAKPTLNSAEEHPAIDMDTIFAGLDTLSPEPVAQYCPQSKSEPILLGAARARGSEVRYGTEFVSFDMDEAGVTALIADRTSGESQTVRADYLIAADGVHSPVRTALSVTTSGYGALPIYVVFIYFRAPWRHFVSHLNDGDAVQVANPEAPGIFLAVADDIGMFITTYFPAKGETAQQFTPQRCRDLLDMAIGEPLDAQIIEVASWQPYEQVADQFCCGRALLVGDSAHTMPPFKAGGANSAIQSAHNLAWKLAAVLQGTAGPGLLASYHAERHPVGRFAARQSLTGPTVTLLELDEDRPRLPAGEECSMFQLLIGYRYQSAAVVTDQPAVDPDEVQLVGELCGQPGTRTPHLWISQGGQCISTLDLLGPGFTLLTGDERWRDAVAAATRALGVPIATQCLRDEAWFAVTGLAPDGALLVRPDDFVGWRCRELPADPTGVLRQALPRILCR
ncbi:FAD-binding protein [Mycobacterium kansasii]|uniref:FAD-dependent monooxygenase n=1 Tax=Mycobacterium kansasii TaxID=1768 RepID=UPI000CDD8BB3|nr:FAD-dependent monooxygenase [Mycobacterium kansasii]POX89913.1 FAD-binding protein [Mycobacterium kansasii]POY04376.1 FAD-binding protein [Mycobacterium kansasii]POY04721.1 FAD-binding protein [Mycobacterium kansasii]POY23599.1 FAD-binding protein [Mycobacterium kansasii]POY28945.1 FAD-binding protein [Mycobacterium kansasii]